MPLSHGMTREKFPLSRFFNAQVEESWRLRILGLAYLWLAALGLIWVGGSLWLCLLGVLGALGHWLSWRWLQQPSKLRSLLIALLVVALSLAMRSQVLQAFEGNWLPMARFLLIVQVLSSFDLRTRGGLYTSMALGGTVLFFASQQSFDPSFGFLVAGFVVILFSFLTIAFLEDRTQKRPSPLVETLARTAGYVALLDSRRLCSSHPVRVVLLADATRRSRTHWRYTGLHIALLRRHRARFPADG